MFGCLCLQSNPSMGQTGHVRSAGTAPLMQAAAEWAVEAFQVLAVPFLLQDRACGEELIHSRAFTHRNPWAMQIW